MGLQAKIIISSLLTSIFIIVFAFFIIRSPRNSLVQDIDPIGNGKELTDLLRSNWDLLFADKKFSGEFMRAILIDRAQDQSGKYKGRLQIKVILFKNKLAAVIGYFKKNKISGTIYFLVVNPKMRNKQFGTQLLKHAIADLRRRGMQRIFANIPKSNNCAQQWFRHSGFQDWGLQKNTVQLVYEI